MFLTWVQIILLAVLRMKVCLFIKDFIFHNFSTKINIYKLTYSLN
jgi:hypothetical protein